MFSIPQFMSLIPCPWARRSQVQYLTEVKEPCNRCADSIWGVMYSLLALQWLQGVDVTFSRILPRIACEEPACFGWKQIPYPQFQAKNLVANINHTHPSHSNTLWNIRRWARASLKISPRLKSQNWVGGREMTRSWAAEASGTKLPAKWPLSDNCPLPH